jgi:hypothetical protein
VHTRKLPSLFLAGVWIAGACLLAAADVAQSQALPTVQRVGGESPQVVSDLALSDRLVADTPTPPDWVTYNFFFRHLAALDKVADKREAIGKTEEAAAWRTYEQRSAGISAEAAAILKQVAYECNDAVNAQDERLQSAAVAFKAARERSPQKEASLQAPAPPEVMQLWDERSQIINARIDQLQSRLGTEAFGKLDRYVRAAFRPASMPRGEVAPVNDPTPTGPLPGPAPIGPTVVSDVVSYLYVFAVAKEIAPGQGLGACGTAMGDLTTYLDYPGVDALCHFNHAQTEFDQVFCEDRVNTQCSKEFVTAPGDAYSTLGEHGLYLYSGFDYPESGCGFYLFWDALHFTTGGYLQCCTGDSGYVASGDGAICIPFENPRLAYTHASFAASSASVTISPLGQEVLPGATQDFTFTVFPSTLAQKVTWSVVSGVGAIDANSGRYTAPSNDDPKLTPGASATIKACSTAAPSACASTTFSVPKISITITGSPLLANPGASETLVANVMGPHQSLDVTWAAALGSIVSTGLASAQYTVPATPITETTRVSITACLAALPTICNAPAIPPNPFQLELVPLIKIGFVNPTQWPAGTHPPLGLVAVTINGSGFGGNPIVTLSDSSIVFAPVTLGNAKIEGYASIPLMDRKTVTLTVSSTTDGISPPPASISIFITPPTTSISLSPKPSSLQETQTQLFSASPITCTVGGGGNCQEVRTLVWTAAAGSIVPTTGPTGLPSGLYTAPVGVASDTVRVCAVWAPTVAVCDTAAFTVIAPTVTMVPPTNVNLAGCGTNKFSAQVTNAQATTVNWSRSPTLGSIDAQGLYTAPCPYTSPNPTTVTVTAKSTIDVARFATATVTLTPVFAVGSISPASGPMAGGTTVTINGSGFSSGATVSFGGLPATGVTVVNGGQITAVTPSHACGQVDVVVTTGGQSKTLTNGFFYDAPGAPIGLNPNGTVFPSTTTSVTLSWAAVSGATQYAVRVQDLTDGTIRDPRNNCGTNTIYVCVGGVPTTTFSVPVRAGHSYTWWVHAGSACGQYSAQTNSSFSVANPTHTTAITPNAGPMAGGTPVTITGTDFRSGATVTIGGAAATSVTVVSSTQITAMTPAHACGTVDVVVTDPGDQGGTLSGGFFYTSPQPPTGLSPNGTVFPSTTTSVTLTWAAVSGATQYAVRVQDLTDGAIRDPRNNCGTNTIYVCVGPVPTTAYSVPVQAGHSYLWWVHAGSACGQYSVQTNGSFSVAAALPAPTATAINPANGPMAGGTVVTITGTGFRAGATVSIGGAAATGVTVVSATSINATTSAHACGTFNAVVTNTDGQSGTLTNGFFYTSPQPPTGLSPNGTTLPSNTTSVTLSWAAVSGATQYAVRVQDLTDGAIRDPRNNCGTNTIYLCVGGVPTTTYSVPVQAGHSYNWWVHAGSACGQYSVQTNGSISVAAALSAPTVIAINPANGPMAGGTVVTISGTGFRAGATVSIGGAAATGVTVVSATSINATTSAHACGTFNAVVTNSDGQSGTLTNAFFYTSPQPPTGLSPNGTTLSGTTTSVTLSWAAVSGATQYAVRVQDNTDGAIRDPRNNCGTNTIYLCVGGVPATTYSVPVQAGHSYTWWVHAGSACGQYSVQTNASFSVQLPAPTLTAVSPSSGPDTGGASVTISGSGFRSGAGVTFGGVAAAGVSVPSGTQITATAPAHAAGTVNIVVTNSDGQSGTLFSGFTYNLSIPPSPTGLSPNGATLPGTTTSVTMSWSPTVRATKYAVRLQDNTDGSLRDPRNNCPVNTIQLCVNDITSTSYSAPVTAGHSYTWWVHAGNAAGYSSQTYGSFSVAVDPLHAPTGLAKEASPSRNLLWTPPNNLTVADGVTYDLWIYGGANCGGGCLYHPAAPSWYTMGAEITPGTYTWTLKANSVSRPSSGAVSGPSFTMP